MLRTTSHPSHAAGQTVNAAEAAGAVLASQRILHVLDHFAPLLTGYTVRSRNLLAAQMGMGYEVQVVTGPLHQLDDFSAEDRVIEGIHVHRTRLNGGMSRVILQRRWPLVREGTVVELLRRRILQLLERGHFDLVHAHSPALNGLAAWLAARDAGVPFVYEIRAFWEDGAVHQQTTRIHSARYHLSRHLEDFVVRHADAVVTISKGMLNDLASRGHNRHPLFHVPNAVDVDKFVPRSKDEALLGQLGIGKNETVLGFVGTLSSWEGIPWLVEAAAALKRRGARFRLLIIGEGADLAETACKVQSHAAGDYVHVLGHVPHDQIQRYYSLLDVLVYPRRSLRVTELVTPLKPLEAMAQEKPVLASDIGGLRELITHGETGLLFKALDVEDFCRAAAELISNKQLCRDLGRRGRHYVIAERHWSIVAQQYHSVYRFAREAHARNR